MIIFGLKTIMNCSIRNFFIWKALILGFFIAISTEILSFFDAINDLSIKVLWIVIITVLFFIFFYLIKKKIHINLLGKISNLPRFEIIFIFLIFFLTFINSVIYPPNTLDAMTYHLPKVMHWAQNNNLDFYPTHHLNQLILAPFSEFVILHLQLLFNGDHFFNLVQWYSMIISCITTSLIAKELGCNIKFQIFSSLFCATIPMGILQATSTQTDYVTSMWLSIMVYFLLKYINQGMLKYIFAFAVALGIGILTKGTFYIYSLPFCIWLGLHVVIKNRKHFFYLFAIPLIMLFLNLGHYSRNINLYNNPLGLSEESVDWTNKTKNLESLTVNIFRNIGLNLAVPNKKVNMFTAKKISVFLEGLNMSVNNPETTKIPHRGYYIPFSFYESSAPNTPHFIIFLLALFIIYKKKLLYNEKYYLYSLITGFLLICFLLKWTGVQNRLLLSFFVLCSPIVSFVLYKFQLNKLMSALTICLCLYSIPYLLFNKSRPLLASLNFDNKEKIFYKPFFLENKRNELYFVADKFYNSRDIFNYYVKTANLIKDSNCKKIGLDNHRNRYLEYPIWVMLRKEDKNTIVPKIKISNVNVQNKSASIKQEDQNCAILVLDRGVEFFSTK